MRPSRSTLSILVGLALATGWSEFAPAQDAAIEIQRGGKAPSLLGRLGDPDRWTAVAVADDGDHVAAGFPAGKDDRDGRIVVIGPGETEPDAWLVDGRVTAIRFAPDASWLVALAERSDRKGRRTAVLAVFDLRSPDRRPRLLALPATARAVDVRREDGRIAVASEGEIRTFEAVSLRSGRIFAVAGDNRSIGFVPGGARILVGRPDGIWRVDLAAHQERDGMPVESRVATEGPVVEIVVSPQGGRALARLEGDALFEVRVDPLTLEATGRTAAALAWPGRGVSPPPAPVPDPEPIEAARPPIEVASSPPEPESPPAAETPPAEPETPPVEPPAALPAGQVVGRLTGPARAEAAAVRLLGPDNVLREAARVPVDPEGVWAAEGLRTGTYRVIAESARGGVLQCAPPFRTIRVEEGGRIEVEPIEVLSVVR